VEARVLNARETAAMEPGAALDVVGSVYFPMDAHLTPRRFMAGLTRFLGEAGVAIKYGTPVTGWRTAGGRIAAALTPAGEVAADEFVLAGGSWSPTMLRGLAISLPMQAGKGYSLTIDHPRFKLTKPMILTEARIAVTPMGDTLRFGGTMEVSGLASRVRPERVRQIIESVPKYLPEMKEGDFDGIEAWHGLRPVSPDGMPYIGRFARHPNLLAACGHAMLGVTLAPITGQLIAEIVGGRKPSVTLENLRPDRFG
jgi:D-amino-acid dehydrogenase